MFNLLNLKLQRIICFINEPFLLKDLRNPALKYLRVAPFIQSISLEYCKQQEKIKQVKIKRCSCWLLELFETFFLKMFWGVKSYESVTFSRIFNVHWLKLGWTLIDWCGESDIVYVIYAPRIIFHVTGSKLRTTGWGTGSKTICIVDACKIIWVSGVRASVWVAPSSDNNNVTLHLHSPSSWSAK